MRSTAASSPTATPSSTAPWVSTPLNQPIVGMAATPDGKGYWLVAADGGIFSYGDAGFYGSTGSLVLNAPIVGMATTHDGKGYWLVAADGGIFTYGDAGFYGSAGAANLPDPVVGMVASPDGGGYLIATANGVVLPFGDAQAYGGLSLDPTATQISAIIGNNQGTGLLAARPAGLAVQLLDTHARADVPPVGRDRRRRRVADPARPQTVRRAPGATRTAPASSGARCSPPGPGSRRACPSRATPSPGDIWSWARSLRRRPAAHGHAGGGRRRPLRDRARGARTPRSMWGS